MRSIILASVAVLAGCNLPLEPSTDSDAGLVTGAPDGGVQSSDAGSFGTDAGQGDAGTSSFDAGIALPVATSATVITHGSIRVQWTNPTPACDAMSLLRSKDGAAAVTASQPSPTAVETLDAPGHASGTYCYSLTCSRGGVLQGTSNQKCATQ